MKKFHRMEVGEQVKSFTDQIWCNDKYQINVRFLSNKWTWLSIKRKDKNCIKDWREMQKIKNALCGEEREGLELYPAESRLVDTSNQFHIFVMPEGEKFPMGYEGRAVVDGCDGGWGKGSKQRPFKENERPKDCLSEKEAKEQAEEYLKKKMEK